MSEAAISAIIEARGWYGQFSLDLLGNSGNNRVYRLQAPEGNFIVKSYFQHPEDPRDRFSAERAFYTYLWSGGVHRTPEPLHWLPDERLAVFEHVAGEKPAVATKEEVHEALQFFVEINALNGREQMPDASEACFSLREHRDCVARRVERLRGIAAESDIDRAAVKFVAEELVPLWKKLDSHIQSEPDFERKLPDDDRCVSPSDFGFHNSIRAGDGKLRFFDFEYAGQDDPAKTVCDFFCQPAVPVDHVLLPGFLAGVSEIFPNADLEKRVGILLPFYQLKWCCIMLNEFLPASAARRAFATGAVDENRKASQLERAKRLRAIINP